MSLAQLQFPAPTDSGLEEWSFSHQAHHLAIIDAMQQERDIKLPERLIYPINFQDPASVTVFMREHQSAHNDFQAILGIQGNDIANVDFTNPGEREAFFFLHFQAHLAAATALKLPTL